MIATRLQFFLEKGQHTTSNQSGFRAGHSSLDGLCRIESSIRTALIQDDYCVAVFIDIVQAFDTVWHNGLIQKLPFELKGNLPTFIVDFLRQPRIKVKINILFQMQYLSLVEFHKDQSFHLFCLI